MIYHSSGHGMQIQLMEILLLTEDHRSMCIKITILCQNCADSKGSIPSFGNWKLPRFWIPIIEISTTWQVIDPWRKMEIEPSIRFRNSLLPIGQIFQRVCCYFLINIWGLKQSINAAFLSLLTLEWFLWSEKLFGGSASQTILWLMGRNWL